MAKGVRIVAPAKKGHRVPQPAAKGHRIVAVELAATSPFAAHLNDRDVVAVVVADEWNGLGPAPQSTVFSLRNGRHSVFEGTLRLEVGYENVRQIAAAAPLAVVSALVKSLAAAPLSDEKLGGDVIILDDYPSAKITLECVEPESPVKAWTFTTASQDPSRAPWEVRVGEQVRWANGPEVGRALDAFHCAVGRRRSPVELMEALDRVTTTLLRW
jgi:hypothetical protein